MADVYQVERAVGEDQPLALGAPLLAEFEQFGQREHSSGGWRRRSAHLCVFSRHPGRLARDTTATFATGRDAAQAALYYRERDQAYGQTEPQCREANNQRGRYSFIIR